MKTFFTTVLALYFISPATAQKKGIFLRVYNPLHTKIYAGRLAALTDTSLVLEGGGTNTVVPVTEIGTIRLKHSAGHKMVLAGACSAIGLAIIGGISGTRTRNDGPLDSAFRDLFSVSPGQGLVLGFTGGAVAGTLAGGMIAALQKKKILIINNDIKNWGPAKEILKQYLPRAGNQ